MTSYSTHTRRNLLIRTIAGITGDVAVGLALSSTCIWIIQSAALGLFLSFLLWIATLLLSLALSQYVVHPSLKFALSDHKLDRGIAALSSLAESASAAGGPLWHQVARGLGKFAAGRAAT